MPILQIILMIALVGFIVWLVEAYVPMPPVFKRILEAAIVIVLIIWLLQVSGMWGYLMGARI